MLAGAERRHTADRESQCPASLVLLTRRDTPQLLPRQGPLLGSPRWIPLDPEAREHRSGVRGLVQVPPWPSFAVWHGELLCVSGPIGGD